jgi:riboflavin biosynthesis pyrimidine reductase
MELVKIPYEVEKIKLRKIFESDDYKKNKLMLQSKKVREVYGELYFEELPVNRPYIFTSLVTSIDGRIAFKDSPEGPLIAKRNLLDQEGASCDFWVLNMLRACCDGIIIGAGTLNAEPDFTGHIFDCDLENDRVTMGKYKIPWNIITSKDGTDIPFLHGVFNHTEIPIVFNTSQKGLECIERSFNKKYEVIEQPVKDFEMKRNKVYVVVTGEREPDINKSLHILKSMGIHYLLVESPTITHLYIENSVMDELFFNYSCIYLGGNSLTIGAQGNAFTTSNRPHTKVVSIHSHSQHFFYIRHKLIYGITDY